MITLAHGIRSLLLRYAKLSLIVWQCGCGLFKMEFHFNVDDFLSLIFRGWTLGLSVEGGLTVLLLVF